MLFALILKPYSKLFGWLVIGSTYIIKAVSYVYGLVRGHYLIACSAIYLTVQQYLRVAFMVLGFRVF